MRDGFNTCDHLSARHLETGKSHNTEKSDRQNSKVQQPGWKKRDYNDPGMEKTNSGPSLTQLRCIFLKYALIN